MDFKDIPSFTKIPTVCTSVHISSLIYAITRYEEKYNLDINPSFQRNHVWTEEQQIKYMEYFLKGGNAQTTLYFNHPNWTGSYEGRMVLVDGKQRLTAAIRFLNGQIPVFGLFVSQFTGSLNSVKADFNFSVNSLKTNKEVYTWYLEMNTGGTPHTEAELDQVRSLLIGEKNA